jgi:hypothetical protein
MWSCDSAGDLTRVCVAKVEVQSAWGVTLDVGCRKLARGACVGSLIPRALTARSLQNRRERSKRRHRRAYSIIQRSYCQGGNSEQYRRIKTFRDPRGYRWRIQDEIMQQKNLRWVRLKQTGFHWQRCFAARRKRTINITRPSIFLNTPLHNVQSYEEFQFPWAESTWISSKLPFRFD